MAERFPYGGQAVMEGVMMRGLHRASVAVRSPAGQIVIRDRELNLERRSFGVGYHCCGAFSFWAMP